MTTTMNIPAGWKKCELRDLLGERRAKVTPAAGDDRAYVALEHMATDATVLLGHDRASSATSAKTIFEKGDLLFGKLRPNLRKCVAAPFDGVCSTDILALYAKNGVVPEFMLYLLHSPRVMGFAKRTAIGTKMPRTTWEQFGQCAVLIPPRCEQQLIADMLRAVDVAIDATRGMTKQTRRLKTAILQDLLTRGIPGRHRQFRSTYRLGSLPESWRVIPLRMLADIQQGIALGPHREPKRHPTPYLRVANAQAGHLDLTEIKMIETTKAERERYALARDDVLLVEGHANVADLGRAALVRGDAVGMVFQNHLFRLRTDRTALDPRFLTAWINSSAGRNYFRIFGGTTSGLNTVGAGQIGSLKLPTPSLDEQTAIADLVESIDDRVNSLDRRLNQLRRVKTALSHVLLTGRMRVPPSQPSTAAAALAAGEAHA